VRTPHEELFFVDYFPFEPSLKWFVLEVKITFS
jgi:hypothetical protein